jgi:4-diphosphocytidyl-2-C-methyl-D-erythritol kinase
VSAARGEPGTGDLGGAGAGDGGAPPLGAYRALAPAKVNLGLFVGARRARDGRHELASVMQSISLADELTLAPAGASAGADADGDELVCAGLDGPPQENLAARALAAFREATGWRAPPLRLSVEKRIPIAAGLGGGSADAAATLRLARAASGLGDEPLLRDLASELGADVPAQVAPGRWLATGAGELLEPLADPLPALELLVLPSTAQLSTAEVYETADRLGAERGVHELEQLAAQLRAAAQLGAPLPATRELLHNDLQQAALTLRPQIAQALAAAREAGAEGLVSGSGPTVIALFGHANAAGRRRRAESALAGVTPAPIAARSVAAGFAQPVELG